MTRTTPGQGAGVAGGIRIERWLDAFAVTDRAMPTDLDILNELLERVRLDHLAWINGDSGGYEFTDERSTILGAFGGSTIGATTATPGQRRAVAQFESGIGSV